MLSVSWWKKLKPSRKPNKKVLLIIIVLALVALLVIAFVVNRVNEHKKARQNAQDQTVKVDPTNTIDDYLFKSYDVTCKDVPPYPGATSTINVCTGKLSVTNTETKQSKTYTISQATHLYKSGVEQNLNELSKLIKNKSKLALTFSKLSKNTIVTINYIP
jgi:hypothetical protein